MKRLSKQKEEEDERRIEQEKEQQARQILQQYLDDTGISEQIERERILRESKYQGFATYNPYEEKLYIKQILEEGEENDVYIRVNIVGNFSQGKTSLAKRLVGDDICDIESTNGIDVDRYRCETSDSGKMTLARWKELDDSDVVKRLALVNMTKSNNKTRFEKRKESVNTTVREESLAKHYEIPKVNVVDYGKVESKGTKRIQRILPEKKLKTLIRRLNEDKIKNENHTTVYIYDFAGQHVFYATHMLFHSRQAVYLLVFDLRLQMSDIVEDFEDDSCLATGNRTVEECLRFWVNSIHSFVGNKEGTEPQIILVGTHKDMVNGDSSYIEKYFSAVRDLFEGTEMVNHFAADDFAVNNLDPSDCTFGLLFQKIVELGRNSTYIRTVPAKWIQLEKSLIEIRQNKSEKLVSLDTVIKIDAHSEVPIADIEHIKLFLKYHHEKGTLFYFDEEPLSNLIVLDTRYLIDAFKCIITSARFCKRHHHNSWQVLMKEAKLENNLIKILWGKDKKNNFIEFKDELLAFLNKHHILSEAMFFDEESQSARGLGWYVVPSLLRNHSSSTEIGEFMGGKKRTVIRFGMKFEYSSIVPTVYHRLISAVIGRWPVANFRDKYLIFKNLSVFRLDKLHCGILEMNNYLIELHVISLCPSVDVNAEIVDSFRRFSESVVLYEFRKHRGSEERSSLKTPYLSVYKCNHDSHKLSGSIHCEKMSDLLESEFAYLPCPDNESHEICAKKAKFEWFHDDIVPVCIADYPLTDKILSKLASAVEKNWELLGHDLGLGHIAIEHINEDNQGSTVMKIFQMLRKWRTDFKDRATMNRFVRILQKRRDVSVDWDEVKNIIEEENKRA